MSQGNSDMPFVYNLAPVESAPPPRPPVRKGQCSRCGYDLAGISRDGVCPECGTPVGLSLRGGKKKRALVSASPEYVLKLYRGAKLAGTAVLAYMLLVVGGVAALVAAVVMDAPVWGVEVGAIVFSVLWFGATVLLLGGWWLFTTPDPRLLAEGPVPEPGAKRDLGVGGRTRRAVRAAVAVMAGATLANAGTSWMVTLGPEWQPLLVAMGLANLAAFGVFYFAGLKYVQSVALASPGADTAVEQAGSLLWQGPSLIVFMVVSALLTAMLGCFAQLLVMGSLVGIIYVAIMYLMMMAGVQSGLGRICDEQEELYEVV